MLNPLTYWIVIFLVAAYAFGRGRLDERLAVTICVLGSLATIWLSRSDSTYYSDIEAGILTVDVLALAGFIAVALRSARFWPLWVAGFQLTSVSSHFIKALHWSLIPQVYAAAERFWIYPIFLAIVVGTWRSHHRWQREADYHTSHI